MEWLSERLVSKKNTKFPNNPYKVESMIIIIEDYQNVDQDTLSLSHRISGKFGNSQGTNLSKNLEESKSSVNEEKIDK